MNTRRNALASALSLMVVPLWADDSAESTGMNVSTSRIPQHVRLIGLLGESLCKLVSFQGTWITAFDRYIKNECLQLRIENVDGVPVDPAPLFPHRLVVLIYQTMNTEMDAVLPKLRDGDVWEGRGFESVEIGWIPDEVYSLPNVLPWRDGRPHSVVSLFNCVHADITYLSKRE